VVSAPRYMQATEPEPASQVSKPATCGATGELAHGGSEAGPLMCRSGLALESEAASIVVCELVLAEVVSSQGVRDAPCQGRLSARGSRPTVRGVCFGSQGAAGKEEVDW